MNTKSQTAPEVVSDFNLEDFSWDAPITSEVITKVEDLEEPEEGEDELEKVEDKVKTKVVTGIDEKGETKEEESEEDNPKQKGSKAKKDEFDAGSLPSSENLRFLRDKGLISFEDEDLSQEGFDEDEFIEAKFEESINTKLEELLSGLPPGLKDMIKYSANGGDFMEVVQDLTTSSELSLDLTLETEEEQKNVVRTLLKREGKSLDEINSYIEFLEFKGRLGTEAESRYEKYIIEEETREEQRLEKLKQDRIDRQQKIESDKNTLGEFLKTKPQILGHVKLNRTEIKELPGYMYEPSVKLQDGKVTTKFNFDLVESLKDKEKSLLLAKIVKSNFNMKDFMQTLETKVINNIENSLQDKTFGKESGSSQANKQPKTHLVDFL